MFNIILQATPVPQQGGGYGGVLLLVLIAFVVYIAIKYLRNTHKDLTYKEFFSDEKTMKNNLYRTDIKHANEKETHRMLRQ